MLRGLGRQTLSDRILLVHHFPLTTVTGVRALLSELLWRIPAVRPGVGVAYEEYAGHDGVNAFVGAIAARHPDVTTIVGVNVHVDFQLDYTIGLLDWCRETGRQVHLYVHDYWPKHRVLLESLVARYGCRLLASTAFIRDGMRADGLEATLVQVGVPLGNLEQGSSIVRDGAQPKVVGSIGRLVPRKRFEDIVAAFAAAGIAGRASLHLRLVASSVRSVDQDDLVLAGIEAERRRHRLRRAVRIVRQRTDRSDYRGYDLYVCASSYEGFSMTPIEAAYGGCPPLMSDIPAHRAIATALFGRQAGDFLFPSGDVAALARLMTDEIDTGRRADHVRSHARRIQDVVHSRWSPARTAEGLVRVAERARRESASPREAVSPAGWPAPGPMALEVLNA